MDEICSMLLGSKGARGEEEEEGGSKEKTEEQQNLLLSSGILFFFQKQNLTTTVQRHGVVTPILYQILATWLSHCTSGVYVSQ